MTDIDLRRVVPGWIAILFGALTTLSGGSVLLGAAGLRAAAGDVVMPILWFNALSGPVYMLAGFGILTSRGWARPLTRLIALAIAAMLLLLVAMILSGTPWELRTLAAMLLRLAIWGTIAATIPAPHHGRPPDANRS